MLLRGYDVRRGLMWLAGAGIAVIIGSVALAQGAPAQVSQPAAASNTVTVVGEGEVPVVPDAAYVSVGVQTTGSTVAEATSENARLMASVLDTLRARGVRSQDIQTSGLSVSPQYAAPGSTGARSTAPVPAAPAPAESPYPGYGYPYGGRTEIVGYAASNTVVVTVNEVDRAGELLDAALGTGANRVGGLRFGLRDTAAARNEAITKAVASARTKADVLAANLGLRVTGVSSVTEESVSAGYGGSTVPMAIAMPAVPSMVSTPVQSGEQRVTAQVRVAFLFGS